MAQNLSLKPQKTPVPKLHLLGGIIPMPRLLAHSSNVRAREANSFQPVRRTRIMINSKHIHMDAYSQMNYVHYVYSKYELRILRSSRLVLS